MKVNAGDRDKRVIIEHIASTTKNAAGEDIPTWATFCRCFVSMRQLSGRELDRMAQTQPHVTHKLETLWQRTFTANITAAMRVKYGSRYLYIDRVNNVNEANEVVELYVGERVG